VPQWAQWAGPEPDAGEAAPPPRTRAPGGRALRAAARRRRRWFWLGGGVVVVAGAVLAVVLLTGGQPGPAAVTPGALITTFQAGELRQVPSACHVVPYALALQGLQAPPKGSPASQGTVRILSGFGDQAFSALQVFHVGGAVTDVATVMVRYHNVVVAVTLNGLEHSNKGNYGPVSKTQLAAAAMAFARAAEGSLH